ncbi:MAG: LysM domain-containing protein [Bacteroidota bacterium]
MKENVTLMVLFLLFITFSANAQEGSEKSEKTTTETQNIITHNVQVGETVMLICKKYLVAPNDIYKLNPEAIDGISEGMVLNIPADKKAEVKPQKNRQVTVGKSKNKKPEAQNQ